MEGSKPCGDRKGRYDGGCGDGDAWLCDSDGQGGERKIGRSQEAGRERAARGWRERLADKAPLGGNPFFFSVT
jgi:hypothetical protein